MPDDITGDVSGNVFQGTAEEQAAAQAATDKAASDKAVTDKAASDAAAVTKTAADKAAADKTAADKTAADKGGLADALDKGDVTKHQAPKEYEAFTAEDGAEIDKALLERVTPLAKSLNLSQENAQLLVNAEMKRAQNEITADDKAWETVQKGWRDTSMADKDIGGTKYGESVGQAVAFLNRFGSPELIEMMKTTGIRNHVEILRIFSKAEKAIGEGSIHTGGAPKSGEKTQAERMFPTQGKKAA